MSKGFTLIEMLVVIGLVGLLSVFAAGIFISNNRFYQNQSGEIEAISGTRAIADHINEYGRLGDSIVASRTYNSTLYTTGATTVIFRIPSVDASNAIIASTYDYGYVTRDPSNTSRLVLMLELGAGSARKARNIQLTDKLSTVSFTYDNATPSQAGNVTYQIIINTGGKYPGIEDVRGGVTLRNK